MGRRLLLLAVLAGAALALGAGCGASDAEPQPEPEGRVLSSDEVSEEFEEEAGRPLEEAAPDPAWEQLGFGLNAPLAILEEYGTFTIYVVDPEDLEAVDSLLADKATGEPLEADADGIYWERDSLSGTWIAHSRYGDNVVLAWYSERMQPGTDDRWRRLDEILSGLATG